MKILLTGATGFLGSHLLRSFIRNSWQVVIFKRSFSDISRIKDLIKEVKSFDIDVVPLEEPFEECGPFDCVVHTATNYGRHGETAMEVLKANLSFPLGLLQAATFFNTKTFFNTTTILYAYLNHYALSKRQFEDWGRVFANQENIQFINIRLEHMYGPGDDPSKFTTWTVQGCLKNIKKLDLTFGEQKRDFIYIDDVVSAYGLLLKKVPNLKDKFQEFDLGTGKAVTVREFAETVRQLTGTETKLVFGAKPYRKHEPMHSEANISRLNEIGWKPRFDLEQGLANTIQVEKEESDSF